MYCAPCDRPFKAQGDLDKHIRNSAAHKKSAQVPQTQALLGANLPPVQPKQQKQPSLSRLAPITHRAKPADSNYRSRHTTTEHKHEYPSNAIASSSHNPQIKKPVLKTVPQALESRWSVIPGSEYPAVLDALFAHCHSPRELKENGYILHPYNPQDYVNSRKCKRCNSEFLILIMELS